jgi:ankyrin repeat protein
VFTGNTALIYSAMAGNDTAIDILLRSFRRLGLNVDHVNQDGMTALILAAKNG